MPGKHNPNLIDDLALHVASGRSVVAWAKEHEIPRRTCYRWFKTEAFKAKVAAHRLRIIDRVVGKLARHGSAAVERIAKLATTAEAEAVRLAANRTLLSELVGLSNFAELRAEIEGLKRDLAKERKRRASSTRKAPG
jgi:hypothetical protein